MQVSPALPSRLDRPVASKALSSRCAPFKAASSKISRSTIALGLVHGLRHSQAVYGWPGLVLPSRSSSHRVAASPPSFPDGQGEGSYTSVKDTSPSNTSLPSGVPAISNGKQNGSSALGASNSGDAVPAAGSAATPTAPSSGFIPHRWRIVLMMSMAFVLCNMDKVSFCSCLRLRLLCLLSDMEKHLYSGQHNSARVLSMTHAQSAPCSRHSQPNMQVQHAPLF